MRYELVYGAGVWEGRGEGDIWEEERKLLEYRKSIHEKFTNK